MMYCLYKSPSVVNAYRRDGFPGMDIVSHAATGSVYSVCLSILQLTAFFSISLPAVVSLMRLIHPRYTQYSALHLFPVHTYFLPAPVCLRSQPLGYPF